MYVSYEDFISWSLGGADAMTEDQYTKLAPMADSIIDHWTLERVGRAVKRGESLPQQVVTLYVSIVESLPGIMENTKIGKGGLVSSFSNGIDSYSFDLTVGISQQLHDSLGWMLNLLPVEWMSGCVSFPGGNAYAC